MFAVFGGVLLVVAAAALAYGGYRMRDGEASGDKRVEESGYNWIYAGFGILVLAAILVRVG